MCFQTFFRTPSQLVPFVRCASDGLNNQFTVRVSLGPPLFPVFVELALLDRTLFSRTDGPDHVGLSPEWAM